MKVLCVPGAATLELILGVVSGAGTENAAGFSATDLR